VSLKEQIDNDLREALKAKDSVKLGTLRMFSAALKNEEIALRGKELDDRKMVEVAGREAKKRKEAIESYKKGGRDELAEKEQKELEVLEKYLPQQLSDDKIKEVVQEVVGETGASGASDFGKVMGVVMSKVKGRADGAKVGEVVKEVLG